MQNEGRVIYRQKVVRFKDENEDSESEKLMIDEMKEGEGADNEEMEEDEEEDEEEEMPEKISSDLYLQSLLPTWVAANHLLHHR